MTVNAIIGLFLALCAGICLFVSFICAFIMIDLTSRDYSHATHRRKPPRPD